MDSETVKMKRRSFLAAAPAMAAAALLAAQDEQTLAINGGKPVRATPLPPAGYPGAQFIDEQEKKEVMEVLDSRTLFRWYGPGTPTKVAKFEEEFSKFIGARYVAAVTSGTAALHCALTALGVGPGDEVILPAWTWLSCYNTILLTGALPVFAEVDDTFSIDPDDIEKKISPHTKAIMVVHLFGCPADMDRIMAVARKHNLKVLEDVAQSAGGQYKGKRLGTIGDIGIFSFQLNKLITAGEGGAVVTNDPLLFERAARFHDLGLLRPGHQAELGKANMTGFVGTNYRMNEMTGAVMRVQLRKLETILSKERRNSSFVKRQLTDLPGIKVKPSPDPEGEIGVTVHMIFATKEIRDKFVAAMRAENVPISVPSGSVPLPRLPYIEQKMTPHPEWPTFKTPRGKAMRYGAEACPRTIEIFDRAAGITIGPNYTDSELMDIVKAIKKVHRALII